MPTETNYTTVKPLESPPRMSGWIRPPRNINFLFRGFAVGHGGLGNHATKAFFVDDVGFINGLLIISGWGLC